MYPIATLLATIDVPVIAIITAFVLCPLNAWINIAIKHAPDKKSAIRDIISILLNVLVGIGLLWTLFSLVREVTSLEPLTRAAVFTVALDVAALLFVGLLILISFIISRVLTLIEQHTNALRRLVDTYQKDLTNR